MLIRLFVKNELGFINETITKPACTDLDLLNCWSRNNNVVISWILNSVSKDISPTIIFVESTHEIWI